jgi:hypothetical protein
MLGATRATLRVPSFIDDVVSAMRQMGGLFTVISPIYSIDVLPSCRYVCGRHLPEKWQHQTAEGSHGSHRSRFVFGGSHAGQSRAIGCSPEEVLTRIARTTHDVQITPAVDCVTVFVSTYFSIVRHLTSGFQPFPRKQSGDVVSILFHYFFPRAIVTRWKCYLCF